MHSIERRSVIGPEKILFAKEKCNRTRKATVCRSVRASFSPEMLPAGTVKG